MTLALDRLVTDVRPSVAEAVDVLHVAAHLESRGITDQLAIERYGSTDVFALAETVRTRVAGGSAAGHGVPHPGAVPLPERRAASRSEVDWGASSVGHGPIYLLPALSMPALLSLVGTSHVVLALVLGGSVGWVWAVVTSWLAYTTWGVAGRESGNRQLQQLTLVGVVVGTGAAAVVVRGLQLPVVVGIVVATVVAVQLGSTVLFFLRRRILLVALLTVPAAVGAGWLLRPDVVSASAVLAVLALMAAGAVAAGCAALLRPGKPVPLNRSRVDDARLGWVCLYAITSVAFLLLPQAVLLARTPTTVVALAGLFLAMGVVEWRGAALSARLRRLLATEHRVVRFRTLALRRVLREGVVCALVCAACSVLTVWVMGRLGVLDRPALHLATLAVPLAVLYLLALVVANTSAHAWLAAAFGLGMAVEIAVPLLLGTPVLTGLGIATGLVLAVLLVALLTRPLACYR